MAKNAAAVHPRRTLVLALACVLAANAGQTQVLYGSQTERADARRGSECQEAVSNR